MKLLSLLADYLWPCHCEICSSPLSPLDGDPLRDAYGVVCGNCNPFSTLGFQYPLCTLYPRSFCRACGESSPHSLEEGLCPACRAFPLPLRELRTLVDYDENAEVLIKRLKYELRHRIAPFLAHAMYNAIAGDTIFSSPNWNLLLPLPSCATAVKKRGFSHTALMARHLARKLGNDYSPFALHSRGTRPSQTELPRELRASNVKGAFIASSKRIADKSILLIDDVVTTASSLSSAAMALMAAGAKSVDAIAIARSKQLAQNRIAVRLNTRVPKR